MHWKQNVSSLAYAAYSLVFCPSKLSSLLPLYAIETDYLHPKLDIRVVIQLLKKYYNFRCYQTFHFLPAATAEGCRCPVGVSKSMKFSETTGASQMDLGTDGWGSEMSQCGGWNEMSSKGLLLLGLLKEAWNII